MKKKIADYMLTELIGSGAYGEVYLSIHEKTNEKFAVKMIPKKNLSERLLEYLQREITILSSINSDNIVKLIDAKQSLANYYLIMEYCNGGDLRSYKTKKVHLEEVEVRNFTKQLISGLDCMYNNHVIHRDLKLANIFLHYPDETSRANNLPILKLGDLGFARYFSNSLPEMNCEMSVVGTPVNMAPELLHKDKYSFKADIWSLGTCIYELLISKPPFLGYNKENLIQKIEYGFFEIPKNLNLSMEAIQFILCCLQSNSDLRVGWNDLKNLPFLATEQYTEFDQEKFRLLNSHCTIIEKDAKTFLLNTNTEYKFSYSINDNNFRQKSSNSELKQVQESKEKKQELLNQKEINEDKKEKNLKDQNLKLAETLKLSEKEIVNDKMTSKKENFEKAKEVKEELKKEINSPSVAENPNNKNDILSNITLKLKYCYEIVNKEDPKIIEDQKEPIVQIEILKTKNIEPDIKSASVEVNDSKMKEKVKSEGKNDKLNSEQMNSLFKVSEKEKENTNISGFSKKNENPFYSPEPNTTNEIFEMYEIIDKDELKEEFIK